MIMFLTCPSDPVEHSRKLLERKYLFKKVLDSQDALAEVVGCLLFVVVVVCVFLFPIFFFQ